MRRIFQNDRFLVLVLCLCVCGNMGAIRKKDDPIAKTQTEAILFKQKLEELKDGPKGAPAPVWKLYPKQRFLADGPVKEGENPGIREENYSPDGDLLEERENYNYEDFETSSEPDYPDRPEPMIDDIWWTDKPEKIPFKETYGEDVSQEDENPEENTEFAGVDKGF